MKYAFLSLMLPGLAAFAQPGVKLIGQDASSNVFVLHTGTNFSTLEKISSEGARVFERRLGLNLGITAKLVDQESGIVVTGADGEAGVRVYSVSALDGAERFHASFDAKTIEDFAVDNFGAVYVAATNESEGFVMKFSAHGNVDARTGFSPSETGSPVRLLWDNIGGALHVMGPNATRSYVSTLHLVKGVPIPSAPSSLAGVYPVGFSIDPPVQTVNPGSPATFALRTTLRDTGGAFALTTQPVGNLVRNVITVPDAVTLTINVPLNQAPGVYRVVALLNNGDAGSASAVYIVPTHNVSYIRLYNTGTLAAGVLSPSGDPDPHYRLISSPDAACATAMVVLEPLSPIGGLAWMPINSLSRWISGRTDAINGCDPGSYRFRTDFDLSTFDPRTADIAVAVLADNAERGRQTESTP